MTAHTHTHTSFNADKSRVVKAEAALAYYSLEDPPESNPQWQDAEDWFRAFMAALAEWPRDVIEVHGITNPAWDDELNRTVEGDTSLFVLGIITMAVFACLTMGLPTPLLSRVTIGTAASLSVLFAILSGFGIAMLAGKMFSAITGVLPFVIMGV